MINGNSEIYLLHITCCTGIRQTFLLKEMVSIAALHDTPRLLIDCRRGKSDSFKRILYRDITGMKRCAEIFSKKSSSPFIRLSALIAVRIPISLIECFFAGYPMGVTHGMIYPSFRPASCSNSSRFIVPPIHVVPMPSDHAYSTIFSKEYPKASAQCSAFATFPMI